VSTRGHRRAHLVGDGRAGKERRARHRRARRVGESVRFVDDQTGTVTVASDLARALVTMARTRPGTTWHVANSGTTTWFDVAEFAGRTLGRGDDFATAIATSDLSPAPLAHRPVRSDLDTTKWSDHYGRDAGLARRRRASVT